MTNSTESKTMIILKSNDGEEFELKKEAAFVSDFVRDSLGDHDDDDNDDAENVVVDVLRVNGECLAKVVEFLKHNHDEEPMPEIPTPLGGATFQEVRCAMILYTRVAILYMPLQLAAEKNAALCRPVMSV